MRSKIKVRKLFAAWDYEKELEFLNKQSEIGWQMYRGGLISTKFKKDESIVYRYQLDFNLHIEDRLEYLGFFHDQGWEYINSTINGWHYFRKEYDPNKPADEYELYTDFSSKKEMASVVSNLLCKLFRKIRL